MNPEQTNLLIEILQQLVVSGQREMGTEWCEKMLLIIDELKYEVTHD